MNQAIIDLQSDIENNAELKKRGHIVYGILSLYVLLQFASLTTAEIDFGFFKAGMSDFKNVPNVLLGFLGFSLVYHMPIAAPYIHRLYETLSARISNEYFFHTYCDQSSEAGGLFYNNAPDEYISGGVGYYDNSYRENAQYVFSGLFRRHILYVWSLDGMSKNEVYKNILTDIGFTAYLTSIWFEAKHQLSGFITHSENSSVIGPYVVTVVSLVSLYFI